MRPALLVVLAACGGAARAPTATPPPTAAPAAPATPRATLAEADQAFDAQRWQEAAAAYEAVAAAGPVAVRPRLRVAIAYAQLGDLDRALTWIERALDGGLPPGVVESLPPLAALVADARWPALRARVAPPCQTPDHRALDFWLGAWDVFDASGQKIGENRIEAELGGCVLVERWTGAQGDRGQSINYWDTLAKAWVQDWIDDGGRRIHYVGGIVDGAMQLEGQNVLRDGTATPSRMTLAPNADGSVLQRIESSDGASWTIGFEATYRKMN